MHQSFVHLKYTITKSDTKWDLSRQRSQSAKNMKEAMENVLPESMKAQVLVKARVEDPEIREFRKKLVESKSVSELSQISGLSDFPIPSTIERLMQSKGDVSAVSTPSFDM